MRRVRRGRAARMQGRRRVRGGRRRGSGIAPNGSARSRPLAEEGIPPGSWRSRGSRGSRGYRRIPQRWQPQAARGVLPPNDVSPWYTAAAAPVASAKFAASKTARWRTPFVRIHWKAAANTAIAIAGPGPRRYPVGEEPDRRDADAAAAVDLDREELQHEREPEHVGRYERPLADRLDCVSREQRECGAGRHGGRGDEQVDARIGLAVPTRAGDGRLGAHGLGPGIEERAPEVPGAAVPAAGVPARLSSNSQNPNPPASSSCRSSSWPSSSFPSSSSRSSSSRSSNSTRPCHRRDTSCQGRRRVRERSGSRARECRRSYTRS